MQEIQIRQVWGGVQQTDGAGKWKKQDEKKNRRYENGGLNVKEREGTRTSFAFPGHCWERAHLKWAMSF
jgi:hypothetical protein